MADDSNIPVAFKVVTGIVLVLLLAPIVVVVLISFTTANSFRLPTDGLSLQWIDRFWDTPSLRSSFLYSMMVAFFAALIATVAGTAAAMWLARALKEAGLLSWNNDLRVPSRYEPSITREALPGSTD